MLRMLPVRNPQQLVELFTQIPGEPRGSYFSRDSYDYYRDHNHVFSGILGTSATHFIVRQPNGETQTVDGESVTGDFFSVLGLKPAVGRLIGPQDDRDGAPAIAVVSWAYWKNRFNLDPSIVGRKIFVDDALLTVAGVAPPAFSGLQAGERTAIWIPLAADTMIRHRNRAGLGGLRLMARLKPGVSIDQARAEMGVLFRFTIDERVRASNNALLRQIRFEMEPAGSGFWLLRDQFTQPLIALMALVGLLLLIACVNIAGMLLARAASRRHEMAVRVALGASRMQIMRLVLAESLALSLAGGVLGLLLAFWGADGLVRLLASGRQIIGLPGRMDLRIAPDAHVLLFTLAIALLAGILFGLAPAFGAFASSPARSMQNALAERRFGKSLVAMQVAFSVVLLSAAGLFVRHLANLENIDPGFRRDHVLLVTIEPSHSGLTTDPLAIAYRELLSRMEAIPGVGSATMCAPSPLSGAGASRFVNMEGHPESFEDRRRVSIAWVAPRYFETLGTPLLAGRDFRFEDRNVAIVNQALARYYFGDANPLGRHFTIEADSRTYQIIGVAGDAHYYDLREPKQRAIYLNAFQFPGVAWHFALRTRIEPAAAAPDVRRAISDALRNVPVTGITTLDDQIDASIVPERLIAALSGVFGALGALLVAIGVYGLLAYTVARRNSEIAIRAALGATRARLIRTILGDAFLMVCGGIAAGAPAAFWAKRFAAAFLGDSPPASAGPILFGAAAMILVALVAAFIPARRAAGIDPARALRHE